MITEGKNYQSCCKISVGIDPSINSTGVCIFRFTGQTYSVLEYHCIGYKPSKTTLDIYRKNSIVFHDYGKDTSKPVLYADKEKAKTENLMKSASVLRSILEDTVKKYGAIDCVTMEGISYGSTSGSSLVDLAGLNFLYRDTILKVCTNLVIASPMEIKKFAVGNGGVDKDVMIHVWKKCEPIDIEEDSKAKVDDIADSYFMALYGMVSISKEFETCLILPKITIEKKCKKSKKEKTQEIPQEVLENYQELMF